MKRTSSALVLAAIVVLAGSLSLPSVGHGSCAIRGLVPTLMTATTGVLNGASLLVSLTNGPYRGGPPSFPTRLHQGRRAIGLQQQTLAPGLVRLTPMSPPPPGDWILDGVHPVQSITFVAGAAPAPPAAPNVRSVRYHHTPRRGRRSMAYTRNIARIRGNPPSGAMALVSLGGANGTARSWGRITGPTSEVVFFSTPGRCASPIPGMMGIARGQPAGSFAYVDQYGQLGATARVAGRVR